MTLAVVLLLALQQSALRDDQCISCHEDNAKETKGTLHERAGVGCVSCHGTDEIVNEKHRRTAAFRPGKVPQIAALCGSCHQAVFDAFKPSDHFREAAKGDADPMRRSSCSACHDHHATTAASSGKILPACLKCHEESSHEVTEARNFFKKLGDQGRKVRQLGDLMARLSRAPGVRMADLESALAEGRSDHRSLEIAQHGLAWEPLSADAEASAVRVDAAYNLLAAREDSFSRRYLGLGLFLVLSGLCAALIVRRARRLLGVP